MKKILSLNSEYLLEKHNALQRINSVGFDGVFLYAFDPYLLRFIEDAHLIGMEIETLHLPYENTVNCLWEKSDDTLSAIKRLKHDILLASKNKINKVVMHAMSTKSPPSFNTLGIENFRILADYCDDCGVRLCLENTRDIQYINFILQNCPNSNIGFCYDTGHAHCYQKNYQDFNILNDKYDLRCIHLHDNNGSSDQHVMPGMGTINWSIIEKNLKVLKLNMNVTLEVFYAKKQQYYPLINSEDQFFSLAFDCATRIEREIM